MYDIIKYENFSIIVNKLENIEKIQVQHIKRQVKILNNLKQISNFKNIYKDSKGSLVNYKLKILIERNKTLEIIFLICCFIIFTSWAIVQPFNSCPDEKMRYDVIKYVFNNNKLPHGGDPLILDQKWGISYAFLPYLSGLVSVLYMKFASIFTKNEQILILAARMAVVSFAVLTVYYVIKIANKCFKGEYRWLFIILVSCLPQFVFLSSYMNNDMLAILSVAIMVFYLLEGNEKKWDIGCVIGLAVGVSICLLSYYNAYPFILLSVIYFIYSNINNNSDKDMILKKLMTVLIVVFVLSSWWFIHNYLIYNGDFLGLKTMNEYSLKNNRFIPLKLGYSLTFMLINMGWIHTTFLSFIGFFGYMNITIYNWMYAFYMEIIIVGILMFFIKFMNEIKHKTQEYIFSTFMIIAVIMNVGLSIFYSYTSDFQPQGRYLLPSLIPVMACVTIGLKNIIKFSPKWLRARYGKVIFFICIFCILINIICFMNIIIPMYT